MLQQLLFLLLLLNALVDFKIIFVTAATAPLLVVVAFYECVIEMFLFLLAIYIFMRQHSLSLFNIPSFGFFLFLFCIFATLLNSCFVLFLFLSFVALCIVGLICHLCSLVHNVWLLNCALLLVSLHVFR